MRKLGRGRLWGARDEKDRDLGFGAVVASESQRRLLNRDGSFNVERRGLGWRASLSVYHSLLTLSWPRFVAFGAVLYLAVNLLFACCYVLAGKGALVGAAIGEQGVSFAEAFFFSVQTLSTIGYGRTAPASTAAHMLVTTEALAGLFITAIATGLAFARFSRPVAKIAFSERAIIAPYEGIEAFEFRIANARSSQISDLEARLILSRMEGVTGGRRRRFYELPLERDRVTFFPMFWTVVHPIDSKSPLAGLTAAELESSDAEFLILLTGFDETFSSTVHVRSSYKAHEVEWGVTFDNLFERSSDESHLAINVGRLGDFHPAEPRPIKAPRED